MSRVNVPTKSHQQPPHKALHPTAYRFAPSLVPHFVATLRPTLPAAGELSVGPLHAACPGSITFMITFEEGQQIARNSITPDCTIIEDETIEKPYGWYFRYQCKDHSSGFIVERDGGRIYGFRFNTSYTLEREFAAYEAGFKFD